MADTRPVYNLQPSIALTTSYVVAASPKVFVKTIYQIGLDIAYLNNGASNSLQLKIEFSDTQGDPTATDWYQQTAISVSGGTATVSLANYTFVAVASSGSTDYFHLDIPNDARWFRVSFKETVVAGSAGSVIITSVISEEHM